MLQLQSPMAERRGLITACSTAGLEFFANVLMSLNWERRVAGVDFDTIAYGTLLQTGLDRILLLRWRFGGHSGHRVLSAHPGSWGLIQSRLPYADFDHTLDFSGYQDDIKSVLSSYVFYDLDAGDEYSDVHSMINYLAALLMSMDLDLSLVTVFEPTDVGELFGLLPMEVLTPIQNLLSAMIVEQVWSPIPRVVLIHDNVSDFFDVLESDLFHDHARAHSGLADHANPPRRVATEIDETGRQLLYRYQRLLKLKPLGISLLQFTPKIVDRVVGKLPGSLSELFAKSATRHIQDRRRVVVYRTSSFVMDYFAARLRQLQPTSPYD